MAWGQLGAYVFERLIGPTTYELTGQEKYAEHQLINLQPRLAHTGTELRVLKLDVQYHADFCKPETEIANLWTAKNTASILPLVLGNGRVVGNFVITELVETVLQTFDDATYMVAKLSISLKEYVVYDESAQQQQADKSNAAALSTNNPNTLRGYPRQYAALQDLLVQQAALAQANAGDVYVSITDGESRLETLARKSQEIMSKIELATGYLQEAIEVANNGDYVQALLDVCPFIPWDVECAAIASMATEAYNDLLNLAGTMPMTSDSLADTNVARDNSQASMYNFKRQMSTTVIQKATRRI